MRFSKVTGWVTIFLGLLGILLSLELYGLFGTIGTNIGEIFYFVPFGTISYDKIACEILWVDCSHTPVSFLKERTF